ncbi:MAG TPA: hypothetical protein VJB82_01255 [Candidatus Peribacterales bacterium]|nr:hypothetical protein [Candidatus Peribacterales bacterium]
MLEISSNQNFALNSALYDAIQFAAEETNEEFAKAMLSECRFIFESTLIDAYKNAWKKNSSIGDGIQAIRERLQILHQNKKNLLHESMARHQSPAYTPNSLVNQRERRRELMFC